MPRTEAILRPGVADIVVIVVIARLRRRCAMADDVDMVGRPSTPSEEGDSDNDNDNDDGGYERALMQIQAEQEAADVGRFVYPTLLSLSSSSSSSSPSSSSSSSYTTAPTWTTPTTTPTTTTAATTAGTPAWLPKPDAPLTTTETDYHARFQVQLALSLESDWLGYETMLASGQMKRVPEKFLFPQLLLNVRQVVSPSKLRELAICPKYCSLDQPDPKTKKTIFIHPEGCPCKTFGYRDPDADQEAHIDPMNPWPRQFLNFIERMFKQGGEVWKAMHKHFVSGTSSYYDAGLGTYFKPYPLHQAIRYGLLTEAPNDFARKRMTAGKHHEAMVCERVARWLRAQSLIPSTSDIRRSDGFKFAANDKLGWLSHSCDGLIEDRHELAEFKVKQALVPDGSTFENTPIKAPQEDYVTQCEMGMLVYQCRRCRLVYVQCPKSPYEEPAELLAHEYIIDFMPSFMTTLIRRCALGIFCQNHRVWPVPPNVMSRFPELGKPSYACRRLKL